MIDIESAPYADMTDDEKIDVVAAYILKKYHAAFEALAGWDENGAQSLPLLKGEGGAEGDG